MAKLYFITSVANKAAVSGEANVRVAAHSRFAHERLQVRPSKDGTEILVEVTVPDAAVANLTLGASRVFGTAPSYTDSEDAAAAYVAAHPEAW